MQIARTLLWTLLILLSALFITTLLLFLLPTHPGNVEHKTIMKSLFTTQDLSFLTESEASHMQDVSNLLKATLGIFLLLIVLGRHYPLDNKKETILHVQKILFGILAVGILLAVTGGFTKFWTYFHLIFFPQGNWMFPATSKLITLYPENYFLGAVLLFVGILLLLLSQLEKATSLLNKE